MSIVKSGTTGWMARMREFAMRNRFHPYRVEKNAFGHSYRFWIGDAAGESWYGQRDSESDVHYQSGINEMQFVIEQMLAPDDIVFECGAHHGWTALQLASFVPDGQVIAFEPNRTNYEILLRNLEENKCSNVRAQWAALSNEVGESKIYGKSNGSVVPKISSKSLFSRRLLNFIYGVMDVPSVSIDEFASRNRLTPTFLKIDVEGFECAVLEGAAETLKSRPKLFIEIHTQQLPLYGGTVDAILRIANTDDYHIWLQPDGLQPPVQVDSVNSNHIRERIQLFALPK